MTIKKKSSARVNVRSITLGINWENQDKLIIEKKLSSFTDASNVFFSEAKIDVRTIRLSMSPLNLTKNLTKASARSIINWISTICSQVGIRWFCVPFDYTINPSEIKFSKIANDIISSYPNAFINLIIANEKVLNYSGILDASKIVRSVSANSNNGFDNFRVGISANCKSGIPFFPFAYQNSKNDSFSFALETVDLFIEIIEKNIQKGIEVVREELIKSLSHELILINELGINLEKETGITFNGIDASLAPFPNGHSSVAKIIELLSDDDFGNQKTLFFTSFLTNIIKNAIGHSNIRITGFNGVMFSLLEDDYLALRAKQKNFNIDSLTLYASVCGCGLDMIPVPGDTLSEEISGMILDISAMALTLNKPLGIRILPIPGKSSNEITDFNYDFLVDTRIMETKNQGSIISSIKDTNFSYMNEYNLRSK